MSINNIATECNFDYLDEHQEHKLKAMENTKFHEFLKDNVRVRVQKCGSYLAFKKYQNTKNPEELRRTLSGADFCKHRFCIMCAWRKSRKLQSQTYATINLLQEQNHKRYEFLFLSMTVPNPPMTELKDTVKKMSKAFQKLIRREEWIRAVKGYIRAIEFVGDDTEEGEAHPHYHCLLMVEKSYFTGRNYLSQERWRELWSECYGYPTNLQVFVEKIKPKKKADGTMLPAIVSACYETIKYSMDLTDMNRLSYDDLEELMKQTRGIRQYNRGGLLKDLVEDFGKIDEEVWQYLGEEFFRWSIFKNQYFESEVRELLPVKMKADSDSEAEFNKPEDLN